MELSNKEKIRYRIERLLDRMDESQLKITELVLTGSLDLSLPCQECQEEGKSGKWN